LRIPRIVIAGATSGVGKTSITCSIIYCLQKYGFSVQPFKVDLITLIQDIYQVFQNMKHTTWTFG